MSYSGSGDTGRGAWRNDGGIRPHAFDPVTEPELFRGVLTRRAIACIIDLFVIMVPIALAVLFIAVFGLVTLGLGWALFFLVSPASIVWALVYFGAAEGGEGRLGGGGHRGAAHHAAGEQTWQRATGSTSIPPTASSRNCAR